MSKFITFEGIDYCGKGTQIKLVSEYLTSRGINHIVSREPGGTALGEAQRKLLKQPRRSYEALNLSFEGIEDFSSSPLDEDRSHIAETLMFFTAREQFYQKVVLSNLIAGRSVIADRFMDSTRAYQGWGRMGGEPEALDFIDRSHTFILRGQVPDRTFYLDIDFSTMVERMADAKGRDPADLFDSLGEDFFNKVIFGYRQIACKESDRIITISGNLSPEKIFKEQIKPELDELFGLGQ
jgi:dTMP kinase